MTNYTYHCGACGRHFHSLHAFDTHRQGDYASNDSELGRHCVSPFDLLDKDHDMVLVPLTEAGACSMYAKRVAPVTVWTHRRDLARLRAFHARTDAPTLVREAI